MKKSIKKVLAVILAVLMVSTSAPFAAIAATDSTNAQLTDLADAIKDYQDMMNGSAVYTNMLAAYNSYITACEVYMTAAYGKTTTVNSSDVVAATNDLNTKRAAMGTWTPKKGTYVPTSSAFNEDSNITVTNSNASTYTSPRVFSGGTGNTYNYDVYHATYQNLISASSSYATSNGQWNPEQFSSLNLYVPNAVILYDGSQSFKARVGVMCSYQALKNTSVIGGKDRRVSQVMVNGNDYLAFGERWYECAKDDGDSALGSYKSRWTKRDLTAALANPSPTDYASGTSQPYTHGTRTSSAGGKWGSNGDTCYIGNYIEFTPVSGGAFNLATDSYYNITSIPIKSTSGGISNDMCDNADVWTGNVNVSIGIVNYTRLINAVNNAAQSLEITRSNAYLKGGLTAKITAIQNAMNWTPSGTSAQTIANTMNTYINAINNATITADSSPYGSLSTEMKAAVSTTAPLGRWYNVNNKTDNYTNESIEAFVKAFTYAQAICDQNYAASTPFSADSYTFSAENVTVGTGDTAVTVSVPACTKTVTEVYNDLVAAQLTASARVDASTLTLYIEELEAALDNYQVFGLTSNQREQWPAAINNAKYRIWGQSTLTDPDTGETYTVLNYPDDGSLLKDTPANQNKVTQQENILRPLIESLTVATSVNVMYNHYTGAQNSLARILQDMSDTNLYPRENYINGDTLDEAVLYAQNNFIPELINATQTTIVSGMVLAKVQEYKDIIQYCQNVIDALQLTFLALDNGTIINQGELVNHDLEQNEDKWSLRFSRYNNVVVFRTNKQPATLKLGAGSIRFYEGDCGFFSASGSTHTAVLDGFNLNDTTGEGASEITKANAASTSAAPDVTFNNDATKLAKYQGGLTVSASGGATYGIMAIEGVETGNKTETGEMIFGTKLNGSFVEALTVTEGTCGAATGVTTIDKNTTTVAGEMYLQVPEKAAVTLTRNTYPAVTTYTTNSAYIGGVYYWSADGVGVWILKNVYYGYYHTRTSSTYQNTTKVVDISNLKELIAQVNTLNKANYTEASWNNMKAKLAAATSNDFGSGATYRDVTTANLESALRTRYQNLYDAWKGLIPAATNIELTRPYAQAQNEGKDIGAVVKNNANAWYTFYNTNNDYNADTNPYGTYTTNTWNAFKAAYEAGDVAIYGDGTNAGIYATPTFDDNGNTVVEGTRGYPRYINDSDNEPLDLGDIEALGLTVDDIEAIGQQSGVSLSPAQAAINQLAADIKSTYNARKRWATFTSLDAAKSAFDGVFASNYNRVYTTDSLNAINTTFAGISTNYRTAANDVEAQHALVNGVAKYDEDDDAAIAAEATAIQSCIPPTATSMDLDVYTPAYIIGMAQAAANDPDAYDASEAVQLATTLSQQLYSTVRINENGLDVEGVNFSSNEEIDDELNDIMTHIEQICYDVTVKDINGNVIETYEDQPYGTAITLNAPNGVAVPWTYNYVSRTVKDHEASTIAPTATYQFVVIGDTTITRGEATSTATAKKVSFVDNLNHVYAVEYLAVGDSIAFSGNKAVITYASGADAKEIAAPSYAFYNFDGFKNSSAITITASSPDTVVEAQYVADEEDEGFTVNVALVSSTAVNVSEFTVGYNDKFELNQTDMRQVKSGKITKAGKIMINGEYQDLTKNGSPGTSANVYAFTIVDEQSFDDWADNRISNPTAILGSETPASFDESYTYFAAGPAYIVVYVDEAVYNEGVRTNIINEGAHAKVKPEVVLTNSKFTMNGNFYLPDGASLVECGMILRLGNAEFSEDDMTITNCTQNGPFYRLKYTKSTQYKNINVSVNRANFSGATRIRYRAYVTYTDANGTHTVYSTMADDTQNF